MNDYWKERLSKQFNAMTEYDVCSFPCYEFRLNSVSGIHRYIRIYPNSNYEPLIAIEKNHSYMVVKASNNDYGYTYYYCTDRVI
jgi:hypothetical protein